VDKVESIEKQVEALSSEELTVFRQWFHEFDALVWDRRLEKHTRSGQLDKLVDEAIQAHNAGKCTEF
jgi:hypothetical protein